MKNHGQFLLSQFLWVWLWTNHLLDLHLGGQAPSEFWVKVVGIFMYGQSGINSIFLELQRGADNIHSYNTQGLLLSHRIKHVSELWLFSFKASINVYSKEIFGCFMILTRTLTSYFKIGRIRLFIKSVITFRLILSSTR